MLLKKYKLAKYLSYCIMAAAFSMKTHIVNAEQHDDNSQEPSEITTIAPNLDLKEVAPLPEPVTESNKAEKKLKI